MSEHLCNQLSPNDEWVTCPLPRGHKGAHVAFAFGKTHAWGDGLDTMARIQAAVEKEREACADLALRWPTDGIRVAMEIRSRSERKDGGQ